MRRTSLLVLVVLTVTTGCSTTGVPAGGVGLVATDGDLQVTLLLVGEVLAKGEDGKEVSGPGHYQIYFLAENTGATKNIRFGKTGMPPPALSVTVRDNF